MPLEPKQVEQKGRDLAKASDHNDIIKLLTDLKDGVAASEVLLRSTKIGVSVNKLKQHAHPEVKKKATELVSKWRMDIARAKGASTPASGANTPRMGAKGSPKAATAGGLKEQVKPKRPDVAPEKRNAAVDGVDWKLTGNNVRDACLKSMYDGLSFMSEEAPDLILSKAKAVEDACYVKFESEQSTDYKTKIRSLFQNLKSKNSSWLRAKVLAGEITSARLVDMTADELKSEDQKKKAEKMKAETLNKAMVAQEAVSISTSLQCGKCKQWKVSYTQAQTRSADEPMTTFCTCQICGNRWKFS